MPVYLITCHAYRSWSEANPLGYVQRGEGLMRPNPELAEHRRSIALQSPSRFDPAQRTLLLDVLDEVARVTAVKVHAGSCTSTHLHALVSFGEPGCDCKQAIEHEVAKVCAGDCPARQHAEAFAKRVKRVGGVRLAKAARLIGVKWFGRGWDVTPVRGREHFDRLMTKYLPRHAEEGGVVRVWR